MQTIKDLDTIEIKDLFELSDSALKTILEAVSEQRGKLFELSKKIMSIQNGRYEQEHFRTKDREIF